MTNKLTSEEMAIFCKKKGFIYQSSEIYGGLSGVYDYGNTGTELKKNWMNVWRKYFLRLNENFVEIDASIIMHENVFKASGHLENFFDPIAECSKCDFAGRADHLVEENVKVRAEGLSSDELYKILTENNVKCPLCKNSFKKVQNLNMMFPVEMGPKKGIKAYLRPETAQSPYVNFKNQFEIQRKKLPLGLALIGRVYRNEIAPRNLVLRTRELEQAELQIFFNPNKIEEHEDFDSIKDYKLRVLLENKRKEEPEFMKCSDLLKKGLPKFYVYHMAKVQQFFFEVMKINKENFRLFQLNDSEKAFYNKYHFDIEVKMNSTNSWVEVGGIHYRTDHDLVGHQRVSKVSMEVFDEESGQKIIPHVLELSFGLGRNLYTLIDQNYLDDKERGNIVLKLPLKMAPYKVCVFPLVNKEKILEKSREIFETLLDEEIEVFYDKSGSVGKRYARSDEIGVPFCITVDYDCIEEGKDNGTVTIRDRDTCNQVRIQVEKVPEIISNLVKGKIKFEDLK